MWRAKFCLCLKRCLLGVHSRLQAFLKWHPDPLIKSETQSFLYVSVQRPSDSAIFFSQKILSIRCCNHWRITWKQNLDKLSQILSPIATHLSSHPGCPTLLCRQWVKEGQLQLPAALIKAKKLPTYKNTKNYKCLSIYKNLAWFQNGHFIFNNNPFH